MNFTALKGAALLTIILAAAACSSSTHGAQAACPSSQSPVAVTQTSSSERAGTFAGINDKHVAGRVQVGGGQIVLSGFSFDEGPDLHIYLTNGTDESAVGAGSSSATSLSIRRLRPFRSMEWMARSTTQS